MALITPKNLNASNITTGTLGTSYYQQPQNDPTEFKLGKVIKDYQTTGYTTTSTSMSDLFATSNYTGFTGGSDIEFFFYSPNRRDRTDWSGIYFEPMFSFDNGSNYYSLGTCGYDGGTMVQSGYIIASYQNSYWIQNSNSRLPTSNYSLRVKWRWCLYGSGGTGEVNQGHDVNGQIVGGSNNKIDVDSSPGHARYQHYFHWIIKEWIPVT